MSSTPVLNFAIKQADPVSCAFLRHHATDFSSASNYIRNLPYGRNADKNNLMTVFSDGCGTCSTKHALLKQLADENHIDGLQLVLCIFKMNSLNTPKVSATLEKYGLDYIPEAHNYLKYDGQIFDFTGPGFDPKNYKEDILHETEIMPAQITDFKVASHKNFLQKWLAENPGIKYSLNELWAIREQCIEDLAG